MSEGVFTATMSYHMMLRRAQELDPVLTYALCVLVTGATEKKGHEYVESELVNVDHHKHPFSAFFMGDDMDRFVTEIFRNMTVRVASSVRGEGDWRYRSLTIRKEFVRWMKNMTLTFDHDAHFVSIPA